MAVRGGDPGLLDQGAGQVEQPARTLEPMSKAAAAAGQKAGGASGNPKVAGAIERFTAAWGASCSATRSPGRPLRRRPASRRGSCGS